MAYRDVPWQRNFRKIPAAIAQKADDLGDAPIQVATTRPVSRDDVEDGLLDHLGFQIEDDEIQFPEVVTPPADMGVWSKTNRQGYERTLTDQPKERRSWSVEVPNWGDWSKGSHEIVFSRMCYPKKINPPKHMTIQMDHVEDAEDGTIHVRFRVEEVLDPTDDRFEDDLFYDLNFLQENVGDVDIFPADATLEDYQDALRVDWELLPPGEREENIARIIGPTEPSEETRREIEERYAFFESLDMERPVVGHSGFQRYFGALISEDCVVFENMDYGNALYIMGENWRELSQLSRTELLERAHADFDRVIHRGSWKQQARAKIRRRVEDE